MAATRWVHVRNNDAILLASGYVGDETSETARFQSSASYADNVNVVGSSSAPDSEIFRQSPASWARSFSLGEMWD